VQSASALVVPSCVLRALCPGALLLTSGHFVRAPCAECLNGAPCRNKPDHHRALEQRCRGSRMVQKELGADQSANRANGSLHGLIVTWRACGRAAGPAQVSMGPHGLPPLPPRALHGAAREPRMCFASIAPRLSHGVHCLEIAVKRGPFGPCHEAQLSVWVVRQPQRPCPDMPGNLSWRYCGSGRRFHWSVSPGKGRVGRVRVLPGRTVSCSSPHAPSVASLAPSWLAWLRTARLRHAKIAADGLNVLQVYSPRFDDVGGAKQHLSSNHCGAVCMTGPQPLFATAKRVPTGAVLAPEATAAVWRAFPQKLVTGKQARPTCAREEGRGPTGL